MLKLGTKDYFFNNGCCTQNGNKIPNERSYGLISVKTKKNKLLCFRFKIGSLHTQNIIILEVGMLKKKNIVKL